jgi:hypothetical protein
MGFCFGTSLCAGGAQAASYQVVANVYVGYGGLTCTWNSHWRESGYNARIEHKERDGKVYLLRESWAAERGLVKPGDAGYYDEVTAVGEEVYCRCWVTYLYALRRLPADMLTAKGREELERASLAKAA